MDPILNSGPILSIAPIPATKLDLSLYQVYDKIKLIDILLINFPKIDTPTIEDPVTGSPPVVIVTPSTPFIPPPPAAPVVPPNAVVSPN